MPADRRQQAAAFRAVNANVTRIHALSAYHAALGAGEADAVAIDAACRAAAVSIVRYPKRIAEMKPGETMAHGAIRTSLRLYGHSGVVAALRLVTQSRHNDPANLRANAIAGIAGAVAERFSREREAALLAAIDRVDLCAMTARHADKTGFKTAFIVQLGGMLAGVKSGAISPKRCAETARPAARESSIPAPGQICRDGAA